MQVGLVGLVGLAACIVLIPFGQKNACLVLAACIDRAMDPTALLIRRLGNYACWIRNSTGDRELLEAAAEDAEVHELRLGEVELLEHLRVLAFAFAFRLRFVDGFGWG